jgi:CCR4-NOT transcription complex subunit 2
VLERELTEQLANYLRTGAASPPLLNGGANGMTNGNGASHSASPSVQTHELWQRQQQQSLHSPNSAAMRQQQQHEPVVRPVQQILSSPVDKWGLKALLFEIKTQMGKTDKGVLMFGEDLSELGLDITSDE